MNRTPNTDVDVFADLPDVVHVPLHKEFLVLYFKWNCLFHVLSLSPILTEVLEVYLRQGCFFHNLADTVNTI